MARSTSARDHGGTGRVSLDPTPREVEALRAYVEEGSYKAAARRMAISEHTLRNHLSMLRAKCGARTTAEAVFLLHARLVV